MPAPPAAAHPTVVRTTHVHYLPSPEVHNAPAPRQAVVGQRTAGKQEEVTALSSRFPGPEVHDPPRPVGHLWAAYTNVKRSLYWPLPCQPGGTHHPRARAGCRLAALGRQTGRGRRSAQLSPYPGGTQYADWHRLSSRKLGQGGG